MKTHTAAGLLLAATLVVAGYTAWVYPSLPERIPIHWNIQGQVDGWGRKEWAAWLVPGLGLLWVGLIYLLPWLSPKHFKVDPFRQTFNYVMLVTGLFFLFLQFPMIKGAFDHQFPTGRLVVAAISLFFAVLGNVLGKVRRNFWVGIRTPWTLASDTVWIATHRLAARLFFTVGLISAVAALVGVPMVLLTIVLVVMPLVPVFYSLILYKRLEALDRV
ncbi:MAG: SdpI family protein [Armatimonadetes bacterium]|nr:SdpI family protein [Armatimonadota bacterium]MDW8122585.1 SdpI family protein [Armatimonadota bacterium]